MSDATGPAGAGLVTMIDRALGVVGFVFLQMANLSLGVMTLLTAATILLRPFDINHFWMWPWTMIFFVWMVFFGLFAVYRLKKDIVIDILISRIHGTAGRILRVLPPIVVLGVSLIILSQVPVLIEAQGGPIDGALLPWGGELDRLALSVPMGLSFCFVALQALTDLLLGRSTGHSAAHEAMLGELPE